MANPIGDVVVGIIGIRFRREEDARPVKKCGKILNVLAMRGVVTNGHRTWIGMRILIMWLMRLEKKRQKSWGFPMLQTYSAVIADAKCFILLDKIDN